MGASLSNIGLSFSPADASSNVDVTLGGSGGGTKREVREEWGGGRGMGAADTLSRDPEEDCTSEDREHGKERGNEHGESAPSSRAMKTRW